MRSSGRILATAAALGLLVLSGCNLPGSTSSSSFSSNADTTDTTGSAGSAAAGLSVQLSWNPSSGAAQGYLIEQSQDGVNFTQIQTAGAVTTAQVSGLTAGETYYFRIRAYNVVGSSGYSQTVTVTPE